MIETCFLVGGLHISLRTPTAITISKGLRPFQCPPQPTSHCAITVRPCAVLPEPSSSGVWHALEYYDRQEGIMRVFHCTALQAAAFAVTHIFPDGNIEIAVRPEYLSYFSGTSGIFNRIGMETVLLQHHGLLLHASLICYNDRAIAFSGPSGVGKSTHAALWESAWGARLLNGDRAVLRKTEEGWFAYGSPYAGNSGIYRNESAPLTAIVVLRQATENRLQRLNGAQALRMLYPELTIHRWDRQFTEQATDLCMELLTQIPAYLLENLPQPEAAELVKKGLRL